MPHQKDSRPPDMAQLLHEPFLPAWGPRSAEDEISLEATISSPLDENCDGCAYCIDPCPFKAITLIEYMRDGAIRKTVESDPSLCKGYGVCQATCPKKGIYIKNFKLEQLSAMVDASLEVS